MTSVDFSSETMQLDYPETGVARIMFCRPERMNAADIEFIADLKQALVQVESDLGLRVLILTGQDRAFCAGLNLTGYGDDDLVEAQGVLPRAMARQKEIADLIAQIRGLRVPVIAAVNGATAGVGLSILCASDIRYAVPEANLAVGYIRAGFSACDMGLSWLLPRIIGAGRAQELMLTGRRFAPLEAQQAGLLADVVAADELMDRALGTARQVMQNAPISVEFTKEGIWASLEISSFDAAVEFENRQQIYTAMTEDRVEATASFLEKRSPEYHRR